MSTLVHRPALLVCPPDLPTKFCQKNSTKSGKNHLKSRFFATNAKKDYETPSKVRFEAADNQLH